MGGNAEASSTGRADPGVARGAEARGQEAGRGAEEQGEREGPRPSRVAQDAEEGRPERREEVAEGLGHARERGGVLGIGRPQREERQRQAEAGPLPEPKIAIRTTGGRYRVQLEIPYKVK